MTAVGHWRNGILALLMAALLASCVIDTPGIETTDTADTPPAVAPQPTEPPPQFEPTVAPEPTPLPTPTEAPAPEPTPASAPIGPPPLPTREPGDELLPSSADPGLVVTPVRGARFMLAQARPILQLGGHTLVYVDDELNAEVDIFTPVARADLSPIDDYEALITYFETNAGFAGLDELSPVSIAGIPTRVFEGISDTADRAFITDLTFIDDDLFGWYLPARMRLWVIDHPDGPVVVSAESAQNPGRYSEAVRLATEILSTIDFS